MVCCRYTTVNTLHTGNSKCDDNNQKQQLLCCYASKTALLTSQPQLRTTLITTPQSTANLSLPVTCFGAAHCKHLLAPPTQEQRESDVVTARITQTETLSPLQTMSGSQNTRVMSQRDVIDYNTPPIGMLPWWIIM